MKRRLPISKRHSHGNPNFAQALGQIASIRVSRGEAKQARERVQKTN